MRRSLFLGLLTVLLPLFWSCSSGKNATDSSSAALNRNTYWAATNAKVIVEGSLGAGTSKGNTISLVETILADASTGLVTLNAALTVTPDPESAASPSTSQSATAYNFAPFQQDGENYLPLLIMKQNKNYYICAAVESSKLTTSSSTSTTESSVFGLDVPPVVGADAVFETSGACLGGACSIVDELIQRVNTLLWAKAVANPESTSVTRVGLKWGLSPFAITKIGISSSNITAQINAAADFSGSLTFSPVNSAIDSAEDPSSTTALLFNGKAQLAFDVVPVNISANPLFASCSKNPNMPPQTLDQYLEHWGFSQDIIEQISEKLPQ